MIFAARRLVARAPAALRMAPTPVNAASRLFTSSALRFAAGPPIIQGEGAKEGEIPTDEQQATGLERFELLGKLQGVDVFDMEPLQMTHLGTTENPIKVKSFVSIHTRSARRKASRIRMDGFDITERDAPSLSCRCASADSVPAGSATDTRFLIGFSDTTS